MPTYNQQVIFWKKTNNNNNKKKGSPALEKGYDNESST
jgi:hypothetical protein